MFESQLVDTSLRHENISLQDNISISINIESKALHDDIDISLYSDSSEFEKFSLAEEMGQEAILRRLLRQMKVGFLQSRVFYC